MKFYITFGQAHVHVIPTQKQGGEGEDGPYVSEIVFDKDCVAVSEETNMGEARAKAFRLFGDQWSFCHEHSGKESDKHIAFWYPRGAIPI